MRNDEFELPDGSYAVSDIQGYIKYIIQNHGNSSYLCLHQQNS